MTTARGQLHPSVQKFKEFVRHHPKMVQSVRSGEKTWQQFYEEWYLLGEQDEVWNMYKDGVTETKQAAAQANESESKQDVVGQVLAFLKNINVDQVQHHLANVTTVIGSVQQVMQSFKGTAAPSSSQPVQEQQSAQNNPFFFQKD